MCALTLDLPPAKVHHGRTEYCRELYNFESKPDPNVLDDDPQEREPETLPVIREQVGEVIYGLKTGKSPGMDNISP